MGARSRWSRVAAVVVAVALIAGCGGKDDKRGGSGGSNPADVGDPVRGGSITYGVEAETGGGWCLPEAQLAISGILVARAIYDTLTVPNDKGEYVPYLAESVEPNDDYTEWTITVRDGVTFHDGTELTATVVKNNLDAYRGAEGEHARSPLLFLFVLDNIDTVTADDASRTVTVTTKVPWVAFPAFLYSSGRLGISGQAQLDDTSDCGRELVGTGPFVLEKPSDWIEGRSFTAKANPDYWQDAPDGEPYPYLDEIVFEPITDSEQRVNALIAGDIDMGHFGSAQDIRAIDELVDAGDAAKYDSEKDAEVGFLQLNTSRAPFDDERVRRAIALAIDPADYNEVINEGTFTSANGPFAPGSPYHLDDTGFPTAGDPDEARSLLDDYGADGGQLRPIVLSNTPDPLSTEQSVYLQQQLEAVGFDVELETKEQGALIDASISGDFDMQSFRNYPGGDPDELYVWFHSGSPVNFGRIDDPEIDRFLDEGRSETDPARRTELYQDMNRRFGEQAFQIWFEWTDWTIGARPEVHGYDPDTMPPLPDGDRYTEGITVGHPLLGLWRSDA